MGLGGLNEFERFEEQQVAKREALVAGFIDEVNLLNGRIEKQKMLETDVTSFLIEQNDLREESVVKFAETAIAEYGEIASTLREAISLEKQLENLRQNRTQFGVSSSSGQVNAGQYPVPVVGSQSGLVSGIENSRSGENGGTIDNSRTINAPINIQAEITEEVDIDAIGQGLARQLKTL